MGCTTSGTISVDWESTEPAVISIHSTEDAQIFIDGERVGTIAAGETVEFTRPPTGKAMVQLQSNSNRREHREVLLVQDTIALEFFTEPVAETPSEPAASPAPTTAPAATGSKTASTSRNTPAPSGPVTKEWFYDTIWSREVPGANSSRYMELNSNGTVGYGNSSSGSFTYDGSDHWSIEGSQMVIEWTNGYSYERFPLNAATEVYVGTKTSDSWDANEVRPVTITLLERNTPYRPSATTSRPSAGSTTGLASVSGIEAVYVPGGSFRMGSANGDSDEDPVHTVRVDSFYIAKTETTFAQYTPIAKERALNYPDDDGWGEGDRPVIHVSWYDAVAFCNALSEWDGLTPAYTIRGTNVTWNRSANGWRLPTEAEWAYAGRGGAAGRDTRFAGSNNADDVAWYSANAGRRTQPVGRKQPNELGLYDMSGNVHEWVWDWFGEEYYSASPASNPTGPSTGDRRVFRGGEWYHDEAVLRISNRAKNTPDFDNNFVGFRVARNAQ